MNNYLKSILIFGILIPCVVLGAIFYFCSKRLRKDESKLASQTVIQSQNTITETQVKTLFKTISNNQPKLEQWEKLLQSEASTTIMGSLKSSSETYVNLLSQSSFSRSRSTNTFATKIPVSSTAWEFSLQGTFQSIQKAYYELESKNPHLFLEHFEVKPNKASNTLQTSALYSAWKLEN